MAVRSIDPERCTSCGACVESCPMDVFRLGEHAEIAYLDDCQACRLCQLCCPAKAIAVSEGAVLGLLHGWDVASLRDDGRGPG